MTKNIMTGVYFKGEESFEFEFATNLTASEKVGFVSSVVDIVVDENYNSMIRDLIFDFYIVRSFTDIDIEKIVDIDEIELFIEDTNIADIVKENMEYGLLNELDKAVDLGIEYRTGIHKNPLTEALSSLVTTIESKLSSIDTSNMMEMAGNLIGMKDEFTMDNLVKAYTSTDVFKDNIKELKDAKEKQNEYIDEMSKVINIKDKK